MGRIVLVANPRAANGKAGRYARRLGEFLTRSGLPVAVRFTAGPGDAPRLAREAAAEGADVVLAVGGDGTLNEVVNGLLSRPFAGKPATALANAPIGTGTDFSRTVRQTSEPQEVLERLRRDRRQTIDVGLVEFSDFEGHSASRYFLNIAEFGSGGAVVEKVNRTTKVFGGKVSFLLGILSVMPKYANKRARWRFEDGATGEGVVNNFVVANGRYFGGGLMPAPKAELDDGLLDVVVIGDMDWKTIRRHLKNLRQGTHLSLKEVSFRRAREVSTLSDERALLDLDGELVGYDPTRFACVPKALDLLT